MFLDIVSIFIKAGDGGNGAMSFHREKYVTNGGPDGGDGGSGGSIIFKVDKTAPTLVDFRYQKHFRADNGDNGGKKNCNGKCGKDLVITVPRGTVIKDKETGNIIADMFYEDSVVTAMEGGNGGKGNAKFASSVRKAPRFAQSGIKMPEKEIVLELKTIADVGLVGFPNVGKSTLLSVVSGARPKIANYHFTTLSPNLGVVRKNHQEFVMADIPGLIEGASQGAGLGHSFLRHIERVRLVVHVVDIAGSEDRNPIFDYKTINSELSQYSKLLGSLPQIVCANKADLITDKKQLKDFEKAIGKKVFLVSAITQSGIYELLDEIFRVLETLPKQEPIDYEAFVYDFSDGDDYNVIKCDDGSFCVEGGLINKLVRNVVLSEYESFRYFQKILKENGVIKKLYKCGAKEGDTVRIGDIEFEMVD